MGHYDLVNVHSVETCFILPLLRLRYKVISTAHGLLSKEPDDLSKWGRAKSLLRLTELPFMNFSNVRTSVSKPDQLYLESRYNKPVHYVPNGIDEPVPDLESANALLAEHGLEPGKYMVFTAGRVVPRKGCHFVFEAMREMEEDVKLLVVGDTSQVPEYTEQLKALADDRVPFCRLHLGQGAALWPDQAVAALSISYDLRSDGYYLAGGVGAADAAHRQRYSREPGSATGPGVVLQVRRCR